MTALTPEEARLADELLALLDHAGRILLAGEAAGAVYIRDASASLAAVADRLAMRAARAEAAGARMEAVWEDLAERAQLYTVGQALFARPDPGDPR